MADKQSGTGARGTGHKAHEGRNNDQANNPVSAKRQSKQQKSINRSNGGGSPARGGKDRG